MDCRTKRGATVCGGREISYIVKIYVDKND